MLAMDRVGVMALEAAIRALVFDLVWPDQDLDEAQEQGHAEDHDQHREHPAPMAFERDVAEARGGERRHGEIERIGIVGDVLIEATLALIDDSGQPRNSSFGRKKSLQWRHAGPKSSVFDNPVRAPHRLSVMQPLVTACVL